MDKNLIPRLPLEGSIDLTYRCNNKCRHCWLWLDKDSSEIKKELNFAQWKNIFDDARKMGTREWVISGGEPMLHPDFPEIFDYLTSSSMTYTLNTNGTMITPEIARMMKRNGSKMVALYGADPEVHDMITRYPGSFEQAMRGFELLKEHGAGFTVQVVPMKDNYHQLDKMIDLAKTLSASYRIGTSWLFHSACRSEGMNKVIDEQRLTPEQVAALDPPNPGYISKYKLSHSGIDSQVKAEEDDRLLHKCVSTRNSFHVDPYGGMANCIFVKDPELRYDLVKGSFEEAWEKHILSIGEKVRGGEEYLKNCGSCENKDLCNWCAVYSWLEHGRYSAPIKYLCDIADEKLKHKEEWEKTHRLYYKIAEVTIQIDSDLPISDKDFQTKFRSFRTIKPGKDIVLIRYHFEIPEIKENELGEEVYRKPPWAIFKKRGYWTYKEIPINPEDDFLKRVVVFNEKHTIAEIYLNGKDLFFGDPHHSLSLFPTDQILLSRIFADREGLTMHSSGMKINGAGLLFTGQSGAGKSTIAKLLKDEGELLCDEFIIIRKWEKKFRIYGNWSHGEIEEVSNNEAPLRAILFLEKAEVNRIEPLSDIKEIISRLLPRIMQPLITADWWEKTLETMEKLVKEVPAYIIKFDKSGDIAQIVREFTKSINRDTKDGQI
ncbi:MAG: radical SAM protein [Candidatus Aminicenantes bacterium]|nr:radical SAM protein [Candidatus Aminicenantes bacterium]